MQAYREGIQKIEIELPQEEYSVISIFLRLEFRVVALRERYSPGNLVCILERTIGQYYHGDPFDQIKFSRWLLNSYIPCEVESETVFGDDDYVKVDFTGRSISKAFSSENKVGESKRLKGTLWIVEDYDLAESDITNNRMFPHEDSAITLILTDHLRDSVRNILSSKGVVFFDKNEAKMIAGGERSSLNIPIEEQDIGGVITVLEREQIDDYAKKGSLTYYLLSGLHWGLSLPDEDQRLILVLYCPNWGQNKSGVIGYCIISEIERPRFVDLDKQDLPADSSLSRDDLSFYQAYSEDERIAALKCSEVYLFSEPKPILAGEWVSNEDVRKYLNGEIEENSFNAAYLDSKSCDNLVDIPAFRKSFDDRLEFFNGPLKNRHFRVGISYSSDKRDFVGKVVNLLSDKIGAENVFYDEYYVSQLARFELDLFLGEIYRRQCDLIVVFFSCDYDKRRWCHLEWRNMRDIIFNHGVESSKIMPFKFGRLEIPGMLSIDGGIDIEERGLMPDQVASHILSRLNDE